MRDFGERALDIVVSRGTTSSYNDGQLINTITTDRTAVQGYVTRPVSHRRFGFHIPPFNSIDHLHLHCLVEPLTFMGRLKYPISGPSPHARPPLIKGYSWFVSAQQAIDLLRSNRRIRVGAQSAYSVVGQWGSRELGGVRDAHAASSRVPGVSATLDV